MNILNKLRTPFIAIVVIITISSLKSCAIPAMPKKQLVFSHDNALIIGSITFPKEDAASDSYFLRITSTESDPKIVKSNSTELFIKPKFVYRLIHKGQLDNGKTYLFAIERPPGKYEIPSIRLFRNMPMIVAVKDFYIGGFSIPFNLKKGEIRYVGNILYDEYAEKNDTIIRLQNNFEKDLDAFKKLQPSVNWTSTVNDSNIRLEYNSKRAKR